MTSTISDLEHDKIKFYTKVWTPTVPIIASVCFVHGFIEHLGRYDHVFSRFAEQGIATFAFDQRGFGQTAAYSKTPGVTSWSLALADINHFVEHTSSLHPGIPLYLMGHSMGGGLVLAFATRPSSPKGLLLIKGVIASAPLLLQSPGVKTPGFVLLVGSLLGKIAPSLTMKTVVKPEDVCRDPVVQKAYAKDPLCAPIGTFKGVTDMLLGGQDLVNRSYKNWPKNLPLLIAHGSGDLVTSHDASERFVKNLKAEGKDATFKSFDGFYHELVQEPGEDKILAIDSVIEWIKSEQNKSIVVDQPILAKI